MFFREKISKGHRYLQIVENRRVRGGPSSSIAVLGPLGSALIGGWKGGGVARVDSEAAREKDPEVHSKAGKTVDVTGSIGRGWVFLQQVLWRNRFGIRRRRWRCRDCRCGKTAHARTCCSWPLWSAG
jgi:hypothetical protein